MKSFIISLLAIVGILSFTTSSFADGTLDANCTISQIYTGHGNVCLIVNRGTDGTLRYYQFTAGANGLTIDAVKLILSTALYCHQNNLKVDVWQNSLVSGNVYNANEIQIHN